MFHLIDPPKEAPPLDPVGLVKNAGVLPLFEALERNVVADPTFETLLGYLPGTTDWKAMKPRLRKPKIFGEHLERVQPNAAPVKIEPVDVALLKEAFTFTKLAPKKPNASTTKAQGAAGVAKKKTTSSTTNNNKKKKTSAAKTGTVVQKKKSAGEEPAAKKRKQ